MDFARSQMQKYGWKDGQGLGKNEKGMKEHVKVKLKMDKTGVGHDAGKEYTNHWWDHVFNKTAQSIQVTTTQDGVEVQKSSKHEKEISKNLQTYSKKAMAYGNFVKKATLSNGYETEEKVVKTEGATESDNSRTVALNYCLIPENEDEIFLKCGGRTAHKGARHGLKLNGKLQRIEEQERLLLDKWKAQSTNQIDSSNKLGVDHDKCEKTDIKEREDGLKVGIKRKKKKKSKRNDQEKDDEIANGEEIKDKSDSVSRKKKRKHNKEENEDLLSKSEVVKDNVNSSEADVEKGENVMENDSEMNSLTLNGMFNGNESKKKKKKKKRKE